MKTTKAIQYKVSKQNADMLTPIGIFKRLTGKKRFLLESSFQHEEKGTFSFIGADPYEEIIGYGNKTTVINSDGSKKEFDENPIDYFQKHSPKLDIDLPLPYFGGAIGYIGYNATELPIGDLLPDDIDMPDVHLMIYKNVIVFDHSTETVYLIAINVNDEPEHVLDEQLNKLKETLQAHYENDNDFVDDIQFNHEITEEKFIEKVERAKQYIANNDVSQVVLSQRMQAAFNGNPLSFYRQLRKSNASPYMFYIEFEDYLILGASPESLIQTDGKDVVTNPIAGTRARGNTKESDKQLMNELLNDQKEVSEHKMLVNLSKRDLAHVCESESITVPVYMEIEKYEHVMHIVSEVQGILKKDCTSMDALSACLPAGTVSGEPKIRAMQIINELETKKRGVYGGSIGYINFNHDLNMALAIRFLVIKENTAYLQTGAGIVHDSDPKMEYLETLHKARSLMKIKG